MIVPGRLALIMERAASCMPTIEALRSRSRVGCQMDTSSCARISPASTKFLEARFIGFSSAVNGCRTLARHYAVEDIIKSLGLWMFMFALVTMFHRSCLCWMFMFVLVTFAIATQLQAMVIVEYSRRAGTATVVFVMVLVISMLFGGFLVNADSTHPGVAWVQYLSLIFYAFEAMAVNEFKVRLLPLLRLGRSLLCLV